MTMTKISLLRRLARARRFSPTSSVGALGHPTTTATAVTNNACSVAAAKPVMVTQQNNNCLKKRSFSLVSSFSSSSNYYYETHFQEEDETPLVSLDNASLQYHPKEGSPMTVHLKINHPHLGGHVLLGPNGTGKSLLSNALAQGFQEHRKAQRDSSLDDPNTVSPAYFQNGSMTLSSDQRWHGQAMTHVSFESHEALIQPDEDGNMLTVQKAISSGGNLNKAAQFLVVRFGLYPFLHRDVHTLSTGEIRKVLLVKALSNRPRLLVLDNAFDGLDVPSRDNLKELVSKTLSGFRPDILIQSVNAKATAHTQVFMLTHRAEEIVDEISTVHYSNNDGKLVTKERQEHQSGDQLMLEALQMKKGMKTTEEALQRAWKHPDLPSVETISDWWQRGRQQQPNEGDGETTTSSSSEESLVHTNNLQIQRGDSVLLSDLNWTVTPGQHWWVAGGNGQGKSTLSRLVAREEEGMAEGTLIVSNTSKKDELQPGDRRKGVGWVSTESHMALTRSHQTVREVLLQHSPQEDETPLDIGATVLDWLDMLTNDDFLERPFAQLSQGEQKLVLVAAALASRPQLLVLDEPCQGLDLAKRQRILGLVERFCQATDLCLIYITHHPEEVLPSVTHVLHLAKGQDVYQGPREDYDAKAIAVKIERMGMNNNDGGGGGSAPSSSGKRSLL